MISVDEDALICDLAETYQIYDYKSLPPTKVAIFCVGLRNDSRIKLKMSNTKYPIDILLNAMVVDRLSMLVWAKSRDASSGMNKPASILSALLCGKDEKNVETFNTAEEFEKKRLGIVNKLLAKGGK